MADAAVDRAKVLKDLATALGYSSHEGIGLLPAFEQFEQQYGLPRGYLAQTAKHETGGTFNPTARPLDRQGNPLSSALGLFQFLTGTGKDVGITGQGFDWRGDPLIAADAGARYAKKNADQFRQVMNRDPTAAELYIMHQQGPGAGMSVNRADDNDSISRWLTPTQIRNGSGKPDDTVGEFKARLNKSLFSDPFLSPQNTPFVEGIGYQRIPGAGYNEQPTSPAGGVDFSTFSPANYLAANPDVARAGMDPRAHYETYGKQEGRSPGSAWDTIQKILPGVSSRPGAPEDFNASRYAALNPDIVAAGMDPTTHWQVYGQKEGRSGGSNYGWDEAAYLRANPDVAGAIRNGEFGSGEEQYWAQRERDIMRGAERQSAYEPYVWDPHDSGQYRLFNPEAYLDANPDLKAGGYDPLTHYELYGQHEGRSLIQQAKGGSNTGIGLTQDPSGAYVPNTGGAPSAADINGWAAQQYAPPPVPDVSSNPAAGASTIPGAVQGVNPDWQVPSFGNSSIYSPYGQPNGGLAGSGGIGPNGVPVGGFGGGLPLTVNPYEYTGGG
jgi:hypothetical protein